MYKDWISMYLKYARRIVLSIDRNGVAKRLTSLGIDKEIINFIVFVKQEIMGGLFDKHGNFVACLREYID